MGLVSAASLLHVLNLAPCLVAEKASWDIWVAAFQLVTWLLVVVGWYLVHRLSLARDRRKEDWERIRDITERVERVQDLAAKHLTSPPAPEDGRSAAEIRQQLGAIGAALEGMRKRSRPFDLRGEIIQLRRAMTLGELDSRKRQPVSYDSEVVLEITHASLCLITALGEAFDGAHA